MALNKRMVAVIAAAMVALIVTATTLTSAQVMADMWGFFKRYEVHLSPEVSGRVLENGAPVSGILVTRELTYEDEYLDKTRTDQDGYFYFPEKIISSRIPGRPFDETRNRQVIVADHREERYLLWYTVTSQVLYHPKTIREKLDRLDCDLIDSEQSHHFTIHEHTDFTHNVSSICRWQS